MPQPFVTITIRDYAQQASTVSFYLPDIDAASFDDVVGAGGNVLNLVGAMQVISAGKVESYQVSLPKTPLAGAAPNVWSAREVKALFTYQDVTTEELGSFEVAAPDITIGPPAGSEIFDLDSNVILAAQKLVIEANAVTRDGNDLTLVRVRKVGRNI